MIFLDTNILVYAVGFHTNDPRTEPARACLPGACLSVQALAEFSSRLSRGAWRAGSARPDWVSVEGLISDICRVAAGVFALEPRHLSLARRIAASAGLSYFDAQMIAVAAANGAETLLTEDMSHGQVVEGVRISNPFR